LQLAGRRFAGIFTPVDWDTTCNIYIECDNFEVLKRLKMFCGCDGCFGELLALILAGFDFGKESVSVVKSYQRLRDEEVVTEPKTAKNHRVITVLKFL
jgi:hypothetical protein